MNDITALAQRMNEVDPRDEFEKLFHLPVFCIRRGTGYASTSFYGWDANTHNDRWEGWKAAMALMESRTVTVKLTDVNEYLAEVHDKTLALTFRRLAEGVRAGDIAEITAAGIKVIEGEG